jgi:hypothetical protein
VNEIRIPRVSPGATPGEALYALESAAFGREAPWEHVHPAGRERYEDTAAGLLAAFAGRPQPAPGEQCRTCDGSGMLTVPDSDGESASEQPCPDPVHDGDDWFEVGDADAGTLPEPQPAPEQPAPLRILVSPGDGSPIGGLLAHVMGTCDEHDDVQPAPELADATAKSDRLEGQLEDAHAERDRYREALDEATRRWHATRVPGERYDANEFRIRHGLEAL